MGGGAVQTGGRHEMRMIKKKWDSDVIWELIDSAAGASATLGSAAYHSAITAPLKEAE